MQRVGGQACEKDRIIHENVRPPISCMVNWPLMSILYSKVVTKTDSQIRVDWAIEACEHVEYFNQKRRNDDITATFALGVVDVDEMKGGHDEVRCPANQKR